MTPSWRRPAPRRLAGAATAVAVVLVLLASAAYATGWRLNLTTARVAPPTAALGPDEVVATYVEAYDHRDFSTMRTIYPSRAVDRHRAIGTMSDLRLVSREALEGPGDGNPAVPGRDYHRVRVTVDLSGLTGSESSYRAGPNGWAYLLERDGSDRPWTIVDHGNP